MKYNQNWARWIFASVCKHFDDRKGTYPLYIEGQLRDIETPTDFFELRMDGPWAIQDDATTWKMLCTVDMLVQSNMDDQNFHKIHSMVGMLSSCFTTIHVYRYGNGTGDDGTLVGCLRLDTSSRNRKRLKISHFGQIRPSMRLMQASVEGEYIGYFEGEA